MRRVAAMVERAARAVVAPHATKRPMGVTPPAPAVGGSGLRLFLSMRFTD